MSTITATATDTNINANIKTDININTHIHNYYDFNTAEELTEYSLIPAGTLAKLKLHINPGNYNDESSGWTDNYATRNDTTGAVYLACEFTVLEGKYAKRKIWQLIGLYSEKNNNRWGDMGRAVVRAVLNSARGFTDKDESEKATAARQITSFAELEGLEFAAKIDIEKDGHENDRNVIKSILTPQHKSYAEIMGAIAVKPAWM